MDYFCNECSCTVPVHPEQGVECSRCNPSFLEDDDLQELNFNDTGDSHASKDY